MISSRRGFTLIELLVAISVLAIVAVLGWRGLDTIVRARFALNSELAHTRGLQLAFAQMQSDCDRIADPLNIGGRTVLSTQPGRLTLVRMVYTENQPSRVQVVAYRLQDGALTRRESQATRNLAELDTAWTAAVGDADPAQPVVLHAGVSEMAIRTWVDRQGWRLAGAQARPEADGKPAAETGLEVTLRLRDQPAPLVKVFLLGAA